MGSSGSRLHKDKSCPPRDSMYQQYNQVSQSFIQDAPEPIFGQRVVSGNNCGPTTEKSSVKVHAPPGGKSSISFF